MQSRPLTFAGLAAIAVLALTGAAGAAEGDPYVKSCFSSSGTTPCAALGPPFSARDAELNPENRHLYVAVGDAGGGFNGVRLFDVGTGGSLTPRAGAAHTTAQPAQDVDVSPDGRSVYVAAGSQLVVLSRDPGSGALSGVQSLSGPSTFDSIAVSPDSTSVYARGPNHLTVFDRNTGTGALTQKPGVAGCLTEETALPCKPDAHGIAGTSLDTVVSPDGRQVYTTNQVPGGIAVFNRAPDGTLTQLPGTNGGCITVGGTSGTMGGTECAAGAPTLAQAWAANLDPQGGFLIVSALGGSTVFRRDATSGGLSQTDCLDEVGGAPPAGCREVRGAAGRDAAVTPDGLNVVFNATALGGLSFFTLDRGTGALTQRSTRPCFSAAVAPPCEQVPGLMGGLGSVTSSSSGLNVFAAFQGGSVASFERDLAPACARKTVSVPRNSTVFIPLSCTDANGDPMKLDVSAPPRNGTLGIVDQKRARVSYKPEINYRGRDVFQYRGTARGVRSAPAVVTVTVLARGRRIDRTPPNTRIRGGPTKTTRSKTARFRFSATERRSRFECKLDKQRWRRCKSPRGYADLKRGRHTFQVRAIDRAGNVDLSPAKRTWIRQR